MWSVALLFQFGMTPRPTVSVVSVYDGGVAFRTCVDVQRSIQNGIAALKSF